MIFIDDYSNLIQEDADEYSITLVPANGDPDIELSMTNHTALEIAAKLLIGAVYDTSDVEWRDYFWRQLFEQRRREHREWKAKYEHRP